jgi:hypothetical protein
VRFHPGSEFFLGRSGQEIALSKPEKSSDIARLSGDSSARGGLPNLEDLRRSCPILRSTNDFSRKRLRDVMAEAEALSHVLGAAAGLPGVFFRPCIAS